MIRIRREGVPTPPSLQDSNSALAETLEDVRAFFSMPIIPRRQSSYKFVTAFYRAPDVRDGLARVFKSKCAYCESLIDSITAANVDRFRPRTFASGLDGNIAEDHYWWLAYEWSNLYLSCTTCGRLKGRRFPVEGQRAQRDTYGEDLAAEGPILVDPCRDNPDDHLVFAVNGEVASRTDRGRTTIDVFGLNRSDLVATRAVHLQAAIANVEALFAANEGADAQTKILQSIVAEDQPFLGAVRQLVAQSLSRHLKVKAERISVATLVSGLAQVVGVVAATGDIAHTLLQFLPAAIPAATQVKRLFSESRSIARKEAQSSFEDADASISLLKSTRCVERIVIKDFRKIHSLDLDLTGSRSRTAPWTMLLGENGVGKSSILQATALALIGDKYQNRLQLKPKHLIRNGARSARVEVHLSNTPAPVVMDIDLRQGIRTNPPHSRVLLLGYGATRLLPHPGASRETAEPYAKVDNLFDPFVPVADPEHWLHGLPPRAFDTYARAIKELFLHLEGPERLIRRKGQILVETRSGTIPMRQLSDGYQSVIGVTADIMQVVSRYWPAMEVAEGVVLIDELGAHLHPRWRMRVVTGLRRAFPRMQFIASTHDPLCLRGLEEGEVIVLRQTASWRTDALVDLPPVAGMQVEQLLTSEHFGLYSTVDPEIDAEFSRYYDLKASRNRTDEQDQEIRRLKAELDRHKLMGNDRRERLMLEAIDDYLAEEKTVGDAATRLQMKTGVRKTVRDIWASELPAE